MAYALLWSGGKDSSLALARARSAGLEVTRLVNFYDAESGRVRFHALRRELVSAQADALGLELVAIGCAWAEMEGRLLEVLARLRIEGFEGVVLGDIHLADVRAWYETRVRAAGLDHVEPLWGEPPARLLAEFVAAGGRAVVTCVDRAELDGSWLGRELDGSFLDSIAAAGVDPCGENGEYHTFCFGGPGFSAPIVWVAGERREDDRFSQLDVALA